SRRKGKGPGEDHSHRPARRAAREAGMDPRARPESELALLLNQGHPAPPATAYRLRGSVLPEHRRVLRQRHGDLHDPGRYLYAPLPVLRRGAWTTARARRG